MTQTLGLDFGGTSIKWVRLSSSGPETEAVLVASGAVPTPRTGTADVLDALAHLAGSASDSCEGDRGRRRCRSGRPRHGGLRQRPAALPAQRARGVDGPPAGRRAVRPQRACGDAW